MSFFESDILSNINFFKLIQKWRWLKSKLGFGYKGRSPYFVFKIQPPLNIRLLYKCFCDLHYQYNLFSFVEKGQILNVRKVYGDRQIHFRIFEDGEVRAHDELNYEFYPKEHYYGVGLKEVDTCEVKKVKKKLESCLFEIAQENCEIE